MSIIPDRVKWEWAQERRYAESHVDDDRAEVVGAARAAYAFKLHLQALHKDCQIAAVKLAAKETLDMLDTLVDEGLGQCATAVETYAWNEAEIDIEGRVTTDVERAYAEPTPDKEDAQ